MKKRIVFALFLSVLLATSVTSGYTPRPIKAVPKQQFSRIVIPTNTPIPTVLEGKTKAVPSSRPKVKQESKPRSVAITKNRVTFKATGHSIKGLASWYCSFDLPICRKGFGPGTRSAAAGPALRAAIGGSQSSPAYRNRTVKVCGSKGCLPVKLVDWCQCYWHKPNEKLIDLYKIVWDAIGAQKGTVKVYF